MMKSDWKKCKVGDTSIEIIDGDRGKNYPKNADLLSEGFCLFLSTKNLPGSKFDFSEKQFISEEKDLSLRKGKLQRNDIAFTTRGTLGHLAWFTNVIPFEHIRINSGMVILRNKDTAIDTKFLFQQLASKFIQEQIEELKTGSAQPQLPIKDFLNLELFLPPVEEQKRIAQILGALDDKIELLQKQNKTLEDMAKALFKSWFVDFDVVRAKQKGLPKADIMREYHLTDELYDLFPSDFENSSLGPIPHGWQVKTIQDVAKISSGKRPKSVKTQKTINHNIAVYGGNGIKWWTNEPLYTIPIIITGRVGTLGQVYRIYEPIWVSDNALIFETNLDNFEYLFYMLKKVDFSSFNRGSTQPLITQSDIKNIQFVYEGKIIKKFHNIVVQYENKILLNNKQIQTLTELRDALLPRLISGKIRV